MEILSLVLYEELINETIDPDWDFYLLTKDGFSILFTVKSPNLIQRFLLWLYGYRFVLSGSELYRLLAESDTIEDFCLALQELPV